MNKELFINGYIKRIEKKFSLSRDFAFEILAITTLLDQSFDEVFYNVSTIVNGNGEHDGGIDGVYIDEDENECTMHVFQIKNSKGLGDNALSKFINDYRNIFAYGNSLNIPLNSKVQSFLEKYTSIVSSGKIVDVKLYFIFSGEKEKNDQAIIQRHLEDNRELSIYDINDLYDKIDTLISENKKRKDVLFSFMAEKSNISLKRDPQALISFQIQNVKAINFRLKALDLCTLLDKEKNIKVRLRAIGRKGIEYFKFNDYELMDEVIGLSASPDYAQASEFIKASFDDFVEEKTDSIILVHNGYVNKITQELKINTLLPISLNDEQSSEVLDVEPADDEEMVLNSLIQKYVEYSQFYTLLDSLAAEHSARMQAMDAATNNAGDMVKELNLQYNKARQEAVTTELIEIISGMEALN